LNRYESTDMRGSAIERSHNRQRKLSGIVGWYFDYVMESLPLMLQAALLLLGCALSRYLWEINIAIASVVIGVTSFGTIFYLSIVIAGTASESCPYQTPAAHIFRSTLRHVRVNLLPALHSTLAVTSAVAFSTLSRICEATWSCRFLVTWWSSMRRPWYSMSNLTNTLQFSLLLLLQLLLDAYGLGRMIVQSLFAFCRVLYNQLVGSRRTTYHWFTNISSLQTLGPGQQTIMLDLQCISWIFQTSLDQSVHLLAFKHLTSISDLAPFHPTLVVDCFNIFLGCININNGQVAIIQGLEQLARISSDGFFRTLHHLATIDPASSFLADLKRRYNEVIPSNIDFTGLPFHSTMAKIHTLVGRFGNPRDIQWNHHQLPIEEYAPFTQRMTETARKKYQQTHGRKVPRRILRSVLYFPSLGPLSPASVVADCLTIIAIDLGCDVSDASTLEKRCVRI
jgi:hypothetical protein